MKPHKSKAWPLSFIFLFLTIVTRISYADVHKFDQQWDFSPIDLSPLPITIPPTTPKLFEQEESKSLLNVPGKELDQHPELMATLIEQAIKQEQWGLLAALLEIYEPHQKADPYLVLYAKGALYRHQKNYTMATGAFQTLLYLKPELYYIRLDLAMMLIEDKQYSEAIKMFAYLDNDNDTPAWVQQLAKEYIAELEKTYSLDLKLGGGFYRNTNVNQASSARTIELWGITFDKDEDSLPKTGHGLNYAVSLSKLMPIKRNHSIITEARYSGTYYWDQKKYNEAILRLNPAYLYQDFNQWLKVGPVYEKTWLGKKQYGEKLGAQAEFGKQITPKQYLIPYFNYEHKLYNDSRLNLYEGNNYRGGITWLYQPKAGIFLAVKGQYQRDSLRDKSESSSTTSGQVSGSYRLNNGLNLQASVYRAQRKFNGPHYLFGYNRKDQEFATSLGIWHSKISFKKITPKLVYRYNKIKSNIPALYSYQTKGFMLEIMDIRF